MSPKFEIFGPRAGIKIGQFAIAGIAAMGIDPGLTRGAIRVSLGYSTTESEIEAFLKAWAKLAGSLYKSGKQQDIAA